MTSSTQKQTGQTGEDIAAQFLVSRDYEIVERNYRWRQGEIDLIARKDQVLVFVEVKTATTINFGAPESWVDDRKQAQIGKAAMHYLQQNEVEDVDCRFDVIAVTQESGRWHVEHFESAFWLDSEEEA